MIRKTLIITIGFLFYFLASNGQNDTIHYKNIKLINIGQKNISKSPNLINWSYVFLYEKDTITINYKNFDVVITIGKNWCLLEKDKTYEIMLIRKYWTSKDIKTHPVYYNYVTFDKANCSLFFPETYKPCTKGKHKNLYEVSNFVDVNNVLYELIIIEPCNSQKMR